MISAALPSEVQTMWWITLGVGVVVAIVVVVLLHTLLRAIRKIDDNVAQLWSTATTVARNTATTWMLSDTAAALDEVKAEALKHDALLTKVMQGNGSAPPADDPGPPTRAEDTVKDKLS